MSKIFNYFTPINKNTPAQIAAAQAVQPTANQITNSSLIENITSTTNSSSNTTQNAESIKDITDTMNEAVKTISDLGSKESGPSKPTFKSFPLTEFGNQKRGFSKNWYDIFPFIEYSISKNAVFCFACRNFGIDSQHKHKSFISDGFNDWKNGKILIQNHSQTNKHLTAMIKWKEYEFSKTHGSILSKLNSGHQKQIDENRVYLSKIIDIIKFLAKQGLALRGHDESQESFNKGNFLELCELLAKFDEPFKTQITNHFNFLSPEIQNELILIINEKILKSIVSDIL